MTYLSTGTFLLTLALLWTSVLPSPLVAQSPTWQRVDQTALGPINTVEIVSILFAADGAPVVIAGDGIYRVEERLVGDAPMLVGIMVEPNIRSAGTPSWSGALYAATDNAVYRSGDSGRTWREIYNPGGPINPTRHFEAAGNLVVPVGAAYRLSSIEIYSADGSLRRTSPLPATAAAVASAPSGRIYALEYGGPERLFHSDDLGETWELVETDEKPATGYFFGMQILSDSILAMQRDSRLYLSTNAGRSWFPAGLDSLEYADLPTLRIDKSGRMAMLAVRIDPDTERTALTHTLYLSSDSGRTWQRGCGDVYWPILGLSPDGTLYSYDGSRLVMKRECGEEWIPIPFGFRNVSVEEIVSSPDGRFYATVREFTPANERMLLERRHFRSDDGGFTWHPIAHTKNGTVEVDSLGNIYITVDTLFQQKVDTGTVRISLSNIRRSTDGGETWTPILDETAIPREGLAWFNVRAGPKEMVAVTAHYYIQRQGWWTAGYYSTDAGDTFEKSRAWSDTMLLSSYQNGYSPYTYVILPDGRLLVGMGHLNEQGVWQPGNRTILYDPVTDERIEQDAPTIFGLTRGRGQSTYAWSNNRAFRSDDQGGSWIEIELPEENPQVTHFRETADGTLWQIGSKKLFRSSDSGRTWTRVERTTPWEAGQDRSWDDHVPAVVLEDGTMIDSIHVDRSDPFFGPFWHYFTIGTSSDGGITWEYPVDSTLDRKYISAIARGPDGTLLVGTRDEGIYRLRTSSGDAGGEIRIAPDDLHLEVAPNPARNRATISFYLDHSSDEEVSLTLYDILGRRVKVLYRGKAVKGNYPVEGDFSQLANGSYLLRLQRGDEGETVGVIVED